MSAISTRIVKAALSTLHYTGVDGVAAPFMRGEGVIFMLHHVTPDAPQSFEPNRILKVTPDFLDEVLSLVKDAGFDIISIDDVPERVNRDSSSAPFAVFTLDDGYKDNRDHAYPVFKRHGAPFTIYVPTEYADGRGDLWWLVLEEALRRLERVTLTMDGEARTFCLSSTEDKYAAFTAIYWWLRKLPEDEARTVVQDMARDAGFDSRSLCRDLVMDWDEIRALAQDPLVTIGAHTCNHMALAKLPLDDALSEMRSSIARISDELGKPCRHFSYPYGSECTAGEREFEMARELGLATAVTTRKGLIYREHAEQLTALPRLSLNGDFQERRYIKVLLSGLPFALLQTARRVLAPRS